MQLYNLKKMCGTFKGYIGECMFQLSQKGVILPRYFPKDKFFIFFGNYIDEKKKAFIEKNYFSIDGIKIIKSPIPKVLLYEVKTKNKFSSGTYSLKMTSHCQEIYSEALSLGFEVYVAQIWLHGNWFYEVIIEDFGSCDYYIDDNKKYDY